MNLLSKLAVVLVAFASVSVAQADIIGVDDPVFGIGAITRDTASGLEWLDLTESIGRSYDDVSTQFGVGGDFEGWEYARNDQVEDFFVNAKGSQFVNGDQGPNGDWVLDLIDLLGVTYSATGRGALSFTKTIFEHQGNDHASTVDLFDQNGLKWAYIYAGPPGGIRLDNEHESYGSALVRSIYPVPEPGTLALFGIGLAAMRLSRRRKQLA